MAVVVFQGNFVCSYEVSPVFGGGGVNISSSTTEN